MDKKKMGIILLILASIAFVLFVVVMQGQFNNPEFENHANSTSVEEKQTNDHDNKSNEYVDKDNEENKHQEETDHETKDNTNDEDDGESEQEDETVEEDRTVNADLLNVRSGPSTDHEISGTLTTGDVVKVYDDGNEWIEIEYEDITGYVNRNFLDSIDN
ncbi:SH3 domain-containing protein [Oceanobacillus sp. 1P07AA]|uniref:SH3 domain-containing protein n=1 Tax=Oceanobacillus sp. 1P07AA TaxID=3132293 RepID=UPI0039A5D061